MKRRQGLDGGRRQRGFFNITGGELLFVACVIGVIGWCVIETLLWLLGHISIGWAV